MLMKVRAPLPAVEKLPDVGQSPSTAMLAMAGLGRPPVSATPVAEPVTFFVLAMVKDVAVLAVTVCVVPFRKVYLAAAKAPLAKLTVLPTAGGVVVENVMLNTPRVLLPTALVMLTRDAVVLAVPPTAAT